MGYETWHNYGYGINASVIPDASVDQLNALLDHAPHFKAAVENWLAKHNIAEPTYEDYLAYDDVCICGLAAILAGVIEESEGIAFSACTDFEGDSFLIYSPSYPWNLPEIEASLTEDRLNKILTKYISILTDEPIEIDYQSVENGG